MTVEVVRLPERTPLIFIEIPAFGGANAGTVLMYGPCPPPAASFSLCLGRALEGQGRGEEIGRQFGN